MNAAVVKRTQEALGKVIRRPPLTEKLLNKPPFRYLHDIITEVIRMTGFMKGLYTDAEMKSDNVKDKDAKISFLQKAIDVVVMVSGEPLLAKPARIVAGHEPERTNELLQRIGNCCLSKLSSDDAVKRVLAGEKAETKGRSSLTSKPQELDNKNAREDASRVCKDKEDRRNSEINERNTSGGRKQKEELKEESKPREKERDKEKAKENDRDRHKDPERDKYHEGGRERAKNRARLERDRDKDAERERERKNEGGKEKEKWKDRERERERDKGRERERQRARNGEHPRDPEREESHEREKPGRKSSTSGEMSKKSSDGSFKDSKAETETEISTRASRSVTAKTPKRRSKDSEEGRRDSRTSENNLSPEKERNSSCSKAKKEHTGKQLGRKEDDVSAKILDPIVSGLNNEPDQETTTSEMGTKEANPNSASVSDANSSSLQQESAEPEPAVKQKGDSPSDAEGDVGPSGQEKCEVPENSELPGELPAAVRRIPRPGSARPAPPRVRRQESAEVLTTDRTGSGKAISNVIVESQNSDNEDADEFVVEAAPQLSEMSELEMVQAVELEDEKHGGLVQKILETKKDYEKLQQSPKPGEKEKLLVFESAWKKEKDIVSKEIEKLRGSIQTLCRSALPLGKIMDYIQEDVDAMQKELQLWYSENRQHAEALQKEQSITDCALEPLEAELAELEQLVRDQQDRICAVKASILTNEEKIQKMVHSIHLSSRS
ncbi:TRAF3-interacting protein 1 isoform X8 [Mesoplodon densirostris]|uniref:TRAF3-interacting protein 1 isoform X8 n=1 Tax=Mesoplodon densirostris TaxID=48708 RepID=UPI0028DCAA06|nr:TRAF3-interacting protein 1 isoform X8 [Mesoplodon densirostris]